MSALDRWILEAVGRRIRCGRLTVDLPGGERRTFTGRDPGPRAEIRLYDARVLRRLATLGGIALADGYVAGDLDSPDLASAIELAALHLEPERRPKIPAGLDRAGRAIWRRLGNATSPRGPLKDIVQHYNLGNDFYALWLDPTMTYSSALFSRQDMTLEEAQREKYRRLAEAAGLRPGDEVLEIGSGWGGFAVYAAEELGCRITATTVSKQQLTYVEKLVAERGLADRIEVRLEDFRDTRGAFDHVVSIEMIESIPRALWDPYFRQLARLTRPGGSIGLEVIVVADRHWRASNESPDFSRRYIFPGGQLPAPMVLRGLARRHGLRWVEDHGYGASYARTLRSWHENFDANADAISELGFDERFRRMWRYYLSYCEGSFRAGRIDVRQIVLVR